MPPQRKKHILYFALPFCQRKYKKSFSLPSFCPRQKKNKFPSPLLHISKHTEQKAQHITWYCQKTGLNTFFEHSVINIHKKLFRLHIFCNLVSGKSFLFRSVLFPLSVISSPSFGNTFPVSCNTI